MTFRRWGLAAGGVLACVGAAAVVVPKVVAAVDGKRDDLTLAELRAVMPRLPDLQAREYLPLFNAAMRPTGVLATVPRLAAMLATLAHESAELRYWEEIASGAAYEGRRDLGNTQVGDGMRFKGRGPLQLTGRENYRRAGKALGFDLEGKPALAATPAVGFLVAAWFWAEKKLNVLADAGDFIAVTRVVNGGLTGLDSRKAYHARALQALSHRKAVS